MGPSIVFTPRATTVRTGKKREWDGISSPDPAENRAYGAVVAMVAEVVTEIKTLAQRYCFASGAFKTFLQSGGSAAMVIPRLGLAGFSGGFGWMIESLNQ
jgi:hypothetical protein